MAADGERDPGVIQARKASHLQICLEEDVAPTRNPFDRWYLVHNALPEMAFDEADPGVEWLEHRLRLPLLIASMTGGAVLARTLNERLARAAQRHGIAMALGSCRIILEDRSALDSFDVRREAPDVLLLANLGAVQLNFGITVDDCRRLCDMLQADGLVIHLNPMQEAIQREGDRDFGGLLAKIGDLARTLGRPLVVKEVGCGISADVARRLAEAGVRHIDVSGRGGTSWPQIESMRGGTPGGDTFAAWGIPTPEAIAGARDIPGITLIAGGGIRHGLDLAKAIAMGAHLGTMALPFARAANESEEALDVLVERLGSELRLAMFGVGARDIAALRRAPVVRE